MKKTILSMAIVGASFVTSGCMTNETVQNLPQNMQLTEKGAYGEQYINAVNFTYPSRSGSAKRAEKCVLMNVSNNAVVLNSTNLHTGTVGRLLTTYSTNTSVSVAGGNIIQYVDKINGEVVASGRTDAVLIVLGLGLPQAVNFKVHVVAPNNKQVRITFSNLTNATTDSVGATSFHRTGAWKGSDPAAVYNALKRISDNIARCI